MSRNCAQFAALLVVTIAVEWFRYGGATADPSPPAISAPTDEIQLRAVGPHITAEVVQFIAAHATSRHLGVVAGKTPRQVITTICGDYRDDYYAEFRRIHGLTVYAPDQPFDAQIGDPDWPACLYIAPLPPDTSLPEVAAGGNPGNSVKLNAYQALTGGDGTSRALQNYYNPKKKKYMTAPVHLTLTDMTAEEFLPDLQKIARDSGPTSNADSMFRNVPLTDRSSGEIVTAFDPYLPGIGGVENAAAHECDLEEAHPINGAAIVSAYNYSIGRMSEPDINRMPEKEVKVTVVDNGFFGAKYVMPGPALVFGNDFPKGFFVEDGDPFREQVRDAWPLNYQNNFGPDDVDAESGHGTHVTGLVLGGPSFLADRAILTRKGASDPWLHVTIVNVGKGQKTLMPEVSQNLSWAIGHGGDPQAIVNMSIAFNLDASRGINFTFLRLFRSMSTTLFVVAAGNDFDPDVATHWSPAGYGGGGTPNVITVAASNNHGALTAFTNRGNAVDLAAPGCGVHSWIDDSGTDAKLSGTSQATPLVTFAASLVKSLGAELDPQDVKTRLLMSGDLLTGVDFDKVKSQSILNIPRALFVFDDFVDVTLRDGTAQRWLGVASHMQGIRCKAGSPALSRQNFYSYKRAYGRDELFTLEDTGGPIEVCPLSVGAAPAGIPPPQIHFTPRAQILDSGSILRCGETDPATGKAVECPAGGMDYQLGAADQNGTVVAELLLSGPVTAR